jgi:hypothetical protein
MTIAEERKNNTKRWQDFVKIMEEARDYPSTLNEWYINIAVKRALEMLDKDLFAKGCHFKDDIEDRFLSHDGEWLFKRLKDISRYSCSFRKIFDNDPSYAMVGLRNMLSDAVTQDYGYDVF